MRGIIYWIGSEHRKWQSDWKKIGHILPQNNLCIVMKQNTVGFVGGVLRSHPCLLGVWPRSWLGSEESSFVSCPCLFFSASSVSETRGCHDSPRRPDTVLTPGPTLRSGTSFSSSVAEERSCRPYLSAFLWFLSSEALSCDALIFLLTARQKICLNEGCDPFVHNVINIYPVCKYFLFLFFPFSFCFCSWVLFIERFVFHF